MDNESEFMKPDEAFFSGTTEEFFDNVAYLQGRYSDMGLDLFKTYPHSGTVKFSQGKESYICLDSMRGANFVDVFTSCYLKVHIPRNEWGKVKIAWRALKGVLKIVGGPWVGSLPEVKREPEEDRDLRETIKKARKYFPKFKDLTLSEPIETVLYYLVKTNKINAEIAEAREVSLGSIKKQTHFIYVLFGVKNRRQLRMIWEEIENFESDE